MDSLFEKLAGQLTPVQLVLLFAAAFGVQAIRRNERRTDMLLKFVLKLKSKEREDKPRKEGDSDDEDNDD